jgi:transcriptional regulator with XRE-family HTH domain
VRRQQRIAQAFGTTLRNTRLQRGLSQDALAERSGFDRTLPSLLERGHRSPGVFMIFQLARGLRADPGQLVADTVEELRKTPTVTQEAEQ